MKFKRYQSSYLVGITLMLCTISQLGFAFSQPNDNKQSIRINRYETRINSLKSDQVNPLLTQVDVRFPDSIVSVGDAVNYLLQFSGYQLLPESKGNSPVDYMLEQPLPFVDRELRHIRIQDGLELLAGKSIFHLVQDPLHRYVGFQLNQQAKPLWSHQ